MALGIPARMTRGIMSGTQLVCDDNSGAKIVEVIEVLGRRGRLRRQPSAGVADIVIVAVKKGKPEMVKKKERAVIIRQKREFARGKERVRFTENACAIIDEKGLPKSTEIKGCVAREIADKFPKVIGLASSVV
ncbi:uL14 family ribosomal protein [Candidatus Micrarchaeota archaeon]|nr:uL14 family ribosomal protein [Candidatus Micrarchaeota archaeon]MBI5177368.1 uL14 family ribosomal protein [Candidatus Micrarchaeota archaeon]